MEQVLFGSMINTDILQIKDRENRTVYHLECLGGHTRVLELLMRFADRPDTPINVEDAMNSTDLYGPALRPSSRALRAAAVMPQGPGAAPPHAPPPPSACRSQRDLRWQRGRARTPG